MYIWQMNDGSWHISLETRQNHSHRLKEIYASAEALALYYGAYQSEADARKAERRILQLTGRAMMDKISAATLRRTVTGY